MKRACVIGWPIEHSRSPLIHGHWLKKYGIDGSYTKVPVKPEDVASFLKSLSERGLQGCNVTVPHKEAAFAAAEIKDPSAVAVGAANTIWLEGGNLACANTDTYGFMTHLQRAAPNWNARDGVVSILGAVGPRAPLSMASFRRASPACRFSTARLSEHKRWPVTSVQK